MRNRHTSTSAAACRSEDSRDSREAAEENRADEDEDDDEKDDDADDEEDRVSSNVDCMLCNTPSWFAAYPTNVSSTRDLHMPPLPILSPVTPPPPLE